MSFNVNSSSYSSYAANYKNKASGLEAMANKSSSEIISSSTTTIQKDGKTYYVVNVNGEAYLYNNEENSWTKKSGSKTVSYNTSQNALSITDKNDKRCETFELNSSNNFDFVTAKKDNNQYTQNVAVIDDFTNNETVTDAYGYGLNLGQTHGTVVKSVIEASSDNAKTITYNAAQGKDLSLTKVISALNDVQQKVAAGQDIDSVNLSMSIVDYLADYGVTDFTSGVRDDIYNQLKNDPDYAQTVSLIDKIQEMANSGISFYISAGNEANDTIATKGDGTYENFSSKDKNHDNELTGDEVGSFNLLTLANSSNVHTIGAKDNITGNVKDYSNQNSLVDALYNGKVNINYLGTDNSGKYQYDIDGDGKSDINFTRANLNTSKATITDIDDDEDGKTDYYAYDIDGDGTADFRSATKMNNASAIESTYISKLKGGFFITGTSFSSPLAARTNDGTLS